MFVFFSFLYNVSNYNTASKKKKKTPSGMFLRLPNVHICHIFTFTVYDISVGMWDLACRVNQAVAWVSAISSRSHRVSAYVVSLLRLHRQNGAKVNLLDVHMSLSHLRLHCTNQSEPDMAEQLKVRRHSICDQNIRGSRMPTHWAVAISFITVC